MKKYLLLFFACFLGLGHAWTRNGIIVNDVTLLNEVQHEGVLGNGLIVDDVTLSLSGEAMIDIQCSFDMNYLLGSPYLGYQLDVVLADGLELVEKNGKMVCENGFTGTDHTIISQKKENNTYRFVVVSMNEEQLPSQGSLLKMYVKVKDGVSLQGQLNAKVTSAKFTTVDFNEDALADVNFHINIVNKTSQNISLTALPTMTYGDANYSLPQTTIEGLPLTWTSSNTTVATVSNNTLTIKGAGTANITASQAGNDSYLSFSREYMLTVDKAPLKITANNCSKTQGEENPELTVSYEGFKYNDNAQSLVKLPTVTTTATKDSPAGAYPITVSGAESDNYTITYANGTLTIYEKAPTINLLYPTATTVHVGESESMSIHLDNKDQIIMFEFYMQLPEGIHINLDADGYYDATLNDDRTERSHSLEVEKGADGLYHFLCYSSKNKPFLGSEGELLTVNIGCDEGVEAGTYQGVMTNVLLSDVDKNAIELQDVTFSIEVVDYIPGDLNGDKKINGMDIVEMVSLIMEQGYIRAADLYPTGNPDGIINGMDLVMEVELVMSQSASPKAPAVSGLMEKRLTMSEDVAGTKTLGIDAHEQFILIQMVVELSEGMTLNDVTTDRLHTATYRQLDGNRYAVVCYSNKNATFVSNTNALTFHYTGTGEIEVNDVMLVSADKQEYGGVMKSDNPTGINTMTCSEKPFDIYSPDGRIVRCGATSTEGLAKGVYIINGQKTVVR